jgi:uncharacterized protein
VTDDAGPARRPADEAALVAAQLGRAPREPWRVASRCRYGFPTVIVSPSRLSDATLFPTYAWLTCPWIAEAMSAEESAGATARWAHRAAEDERVSAGLIAADGQLRLARAAETGGEDPCASVGLAGQRDPLGVKCLHAHAALALIGIEDPVGLAELGKIDRDCPDGRCAKIVTPVPQERAY